MEMRKELEEIELIELYLNNELNQEEKSAFENRMKTDAAFKEEVELQKDLLEGLERLALKEEIKAAQNEYMKTNWGLYLGIFLGLIALGSVYLYLNQEEESIETIARQYTSYQVPRHALAINASDSIEEDSLAFETPNLQDLDTTSETVSNLLELPQKKFQYFILYPEKDTVVKGKEGTIIKIEKESFESNENRLVIKLKEYYKTSDIAFANLSTSTNDNQILETGGMIYLEVTTESNKKVKLKADKEILLKFPRQKKNMRLFKGLENSDEIIEWEAIPQKKEIIKEEITPNTIQRLNLSSNVSETFTIVETMPVFVGCTSGEGTAKQQECTKEKTIEYIKENFKFPAEAIDDKAKGTVYLTYTINPYGFVEGVEVKKGIHPAVDEEAIKVVSSLPRYKPGKQRGKAVRIEYSLPIELNFRNYRNKSYTDRERKVINDSILQKRENEMAQMKETELNSIDKQLQKKGTNKQQLAEDIEYFVLGSSNLGWINCDRFIRDKREKIDFTLNKLARNSHVRLIFKDINSITAATYNKGSFHFKDFPLGAEVKIFAVVHGDNQTYVCLQDAQISRESPQLNFKAVGKEDLRDIVEEINNIGK